MKKLKRGRLLAEIEQDKFEKLSELGAGDFEHIDGSLIEHLTGTKKLLVSWNASYELQDAGLYHAAYGTAGFDQRLVSDKQRDKISAIIGKSAEAIVYLYCACDRDYFWPQFGRSDSLEFRDRFTGEMTRLSRQELNNFCELTVANELEIANGNQPFIDQHGAELYRLFKNMRQYLSRHADASVESLLG